MICVFVLITVSAFSLHAEPSLPIKNPSVEELLDSSEIITTFKVVHVEMWEDFFVFKNGVKGRKGRGIRFFGKPVDVLKEKRHLNWRTKLSWFSDYGSDHVHYDSLGNLTEMYAPLTVRRSRGIIYSVLPDSTYLCFFSVHADSEDTTIRLDYIGPLDMVCQLDNYIEGHEKLQKYCAAVTAKWKEEKDTEKMIEDAKRELEAREREYKRLHPDE